MSHQEVVAYLQSNPHALAKVLKRIPNECAVALKGEPNALAIMLEAEEFRELFRSYASSPAPEEGKEHR